MQYCMINAGTGDVTQAELGNGSKMSFEIEQRFLEEIAPFKEPQDESVGVFHVRGGQGRSEPPGQQRERPRGAKTSLGLLGEGEKCRQEQRELGRGSGERVRMKREPGRVSDTTQRRADRSGELRFHPPIAGGPQCVAGRRETAGGSHPERLAAAAEKRGGRESRPAARRPSWRFGICPGLDQGAFMGRERSERLGLGDQSHVGVTRGHQGRPSVSGPV